MRISIVLMSAFLFLTPLLKADLPLIGTTKDGIFEELETQLKGAGVHGWIHGAVNEYSQYVFTYRTPGNFFEHWEFPVTSENTEVKNFLRSATRHDEVIIKGAFLHNGAPINHIDAKEISVVKKFEDGMLLPKYSHEAKLPEELLSTNELVGKVHAVADGGKILVIEYKDAVVPVVVSKPELTKGLYRNDKVKLIYKVRVHPHSPSHISLDVNHPNPLVVLDKMVEIHGKAGSVTGHLILFPKSPQVLFNVFALQQVDSLGVKREFTLVNFEDPKVFEAIRNKLQELWDATPSHIINARNKYVNLSVKLKATGTFNVVDPGQANPQILLTGTESIEVVK